MSERDLRAAERWYRDQAAIEAKAAAKRRGKPRRAALDRAAAWVALADEIDAYLSPAHAEDVLM